MIRISNRNSILPYVVNHDSCLTALLIISSVALVAVAPLKETVAVPVYVQSNA
jgi:hypothetical protein